MPDRNLIGPVLRCQLHGLHHRIHRPTGLQVTPHNRNTRYLLTPQAAGVDPCNAVGQTPRGRDPVLFCQS